MSSSVNNEIYWNKESLREHIKLLRYGVFEGVKNYYMVYIDKVAVAPDSILSRYLYALKLDDETKEKEVGKVKSLVMAAYEMSNKQQWIDADEFIEREFSSL